MMYPFVFFDLTGTLIQKSPSFEHVLKQTLRANGILVSEKETSLANEYVELWIGQQILRENQSGIRMPDEEFSDHICSILAEHLLKSSPAPKAYEALRNLVHLGYDSEYIPTEGSLECLKTLKKRGHKLAVVSNNPPKIRNVVKKLGLADFFDEIILSSEVGLEKPDPEILRLACRKLGAEPCRSVYVGDHPLDILCAGQAGMDAVWYAVKKTAGLKMYSAYKPKHILTSFAYLPDIVS